MDDVVHPNFKQHPNLRRFSSTNQPNHTARAEAQKAKSSVKEALLNSLDKLGNEAFFLSLARGSAEDRRCYAMIVAKLLPIEVQGALDATLTVKVVTMLGDAEVEIARPIPKDATPLLGQPAMSGEGRAPEDA